MDCDICFEQYDTGQHTPKLVPCGHTVCLQCLQLSDKHECPLDRSVYGVHPTHLPTNYTLLRVLEERYGDDRIGQRLYPPPPPIPPHLQQPAPPPPPPPTASPSWPHPPEAVAAETAPTVIVVESTRRQGTTSKDQKGIKVLVNVVVMIGLVVYLVLRYCR